MIGVLHQHRHHENKALEVTERKHSIDPNLCAAAVWSFCRLRRAGIFQMRLQSANRALDDCALRPGTCPLSEYIVRVHAVLKTDNEALLCRLRIACQQEGELVEILQIIAETTANIRGARVLICSLKAKEIFSRSLERHCCFRRIDLFVSFSSDIGGSFEGTRLLRHHRFDACATAVAIRMNKLSSS